MAIVGFIVALSLILAACGGETSEEPIKIGVIAGLSGAGTSYGLGIQQGAEMAVEEINAEGGINGQMLELVIVDDASDPSQTVTAMQRLIDQEKVDVLVGGWGSSQVLAHQGTVEASGVPYVIVGATNPAITSVDNTWSYRVIKSDALQAREIADIAVNKLACEVIAIMFDSNDYGTGNHDVFVEGLSEIGVEPAVEQTYQTNDKDFTAQLTNIREANPDCMAIFGTIPGAPAIMEQARVLGITARFIGTGGLANEQLMSLAGDAAEGTIITTYFHEDTDAEAGAWAEAYIEKYSGGDAPPRPVLAAWEYRVIKYIIASILRDVGTDKDAVRQALEDWEGTIPGLEGKVYFDETGQLAQVSVLVEVRDGVFKLYQP
jgi:branched-chain amino acid transport system substrate-binding protein